VNRLRPLFRSKNGGTSTTLGGGLEAECPCPMLADLTEAQCGLRSGSQHAASSRVHQPKPSCLPVGAKDFERVRAQG
jgi:hypothetical protein